MSRHFISTMVLLLAGLCLSSCSNWSDMVADSNSSAELTELCDRVHDEVNAYRKEMGDSPLERHPGLDRLALGHSHFLSKRRPLAFLLGENVSHSGSGTRARSALLRHDMTSYGENVAAIRSGPENIAEHLVFMWKTSEPHHRAMRGDWSHTGLGIAVDRDGMLFATQVFTARSATP